MLIKIDVLKKHPTVDGTPIIVCGNSGYQIRFTFDEEWAGQQYKTARFVYRKSGQNQYTDVPFSGDTVDMPVLSGVSFVLVGVYTDFLRTTTPAKIPCERSIRCDPGENVEAPTPELYDQLMALFNQVTLEQEVAKGAAKTAAEAAASASETAKLAEDNAIARLKEKNSGTYITFWVGTKAQYEALESTEANCVYIISDDTSTDDLLAQIAALTQDTTALKAATTPVDISDKVNLSWLTIGGGANLTELYIRNKKYIYHPDKKMVFFEFQIEYKGSANAGELVLFGHMGGYAPTNQSGIPAITQKASLDVGYNYHSSWGGFLFSMYFREAFSSDETTKASVCGWYFCDGEGE